jgi:hypothetical protein
MVIIHDDLLVIVLIPSELHSFLACYISWSCWRLISACLWKNTASVEGTCVPLWPLILYRIGLLFA